MLTSYWLALHGLPWQALINCAPLTDSVASGSTASSSASSTTKTFPSSVTGTSASITATTTVSDGSSDTAGSSASEVGGEAETTDAPVATPTTSTSDKCSVRRRRN
ncbi:hypothetical protein DVH05_000504 [Phytophthora capsici]|nr:hypothetical protein DVH05_012368 [Phytophthora capsici]KAG1712769.1 hypothetical protein DVH05_000504 [Phytophthora capsici]